MPAAAPAKPRRPDEPAGPLLRVDSLHVRFGSQEVLRDISIDLEPGRTLVILGESGCGKTVLLKSMIGLIRPTRGDVQFEGRSLAGLNDRSLAHLRTRYGFVFQGAALFDSLTILDNIAFPLREHTRIPDAEVRTIVESLLDEVGLPRSVLPKKPVQLSGGMRKRAGLARALALDPQLVLYDEPTTGLDPIMSDVINELIIRVRGRPYVTSVVVTHDMHTARKVADRVIMLYPVFRLRPDEPQVVFDGTVEELDRSRDPRIRQFVEGRAGARLMELREEQARDHEIQAESTATADADADTLEGEADA
ncbi:MAG: ATP-binding cassette domain-containing protein [Planctomycetia bacterium]|nr:ATP-binding cassette domain-containing protein [Planctomycetia bacterium]